MTNSPLNDLQGKNCVITGGAGILGASMAEALALAGVNLAIVDLNKETACKLANHLQEKYPIKAMGVSANVLQKESLILAQQHIAKSFYCIAMRADHAQANLYDQRKKPISDIRLLDF